MTESYTSTGRRGWVGIDRHWLTDERMSSSMIHLMLWLDSHTPEFLACVHLKQAADSLHWSRDRVMRAVAELEALELISTELVKHGEGKRTRFTLHQSAWSDRASNHDTPVSQNTTHPVQRNTTPTNSTSNVVGEHFQELAETVVSTDAEMLCNQLADALQAYSTNGQRLTVGKTWMKDMERMIRLDEREPEQVSRVIRWLYTATDEVATFWAPNVQSPGTLRMRWETIAQQVRRQRLQPQQTGGLAAVRRQQAQRAAEQ